MCELIRFIRETSSHEMTVLRDDGVYRHLRFKRPNTGAYYFDIVTWPGYLTITGDMGTWTFSRVSDMFDFFSSAHFGDRESFRINPGYWAEKFESGAGGSRYETPCYEFDGDAFDKGIQEWLSAYLENCDDEDDSDVAKEAVRELCGNGFRRASDAYHALNDAYLPNNVSSYDISEGMGSNMTYSHHYLWVCYAIVWGIERYRNKQAALKAVSTFLTFSSLHDVIKGGCHA